MQLIFQRQPPEAIRNQLEGFKIMRENKKTHTKNYLSVQSLVKKHDCSYGFASKVLKLCHNKLEKASEVINLSKQNRKIPRPVGYGYINFTHEGTGRDCEEQKLLHPVFMQGEWKPAGTETVFTG